MICIAHSAINNIIIFIYYQTPYYICFGIWFKEKPKSNGNVYSKIILVGTGHSCMGFGEREVKADFSAPCSACICLDQIIYEYQNIHICSEIIYYIKLLCFFTQMDIKTYTGGGGSRKNKIKYLKWKNEICSWFFWHPSVAVAWRRICQHKLGLSTSHLKRHPILIRFIVSLFALHVC